MFKIISSLIEGLFQVPGESLKLKQLKLLIDEHSSSVFSNFSSKRDAIAYLKQKVCFLATVEHVPYLTQIIFVL